MKKLLILFLLAAGFAQPTYGQDTLITPKGRYLLKETFFSKDSSFVFSADVRKIVAVVPPPVVEPDPEPPLVSCDNGDSGFSILEVSATTNSVEFKFNAANLSAGTWKIGVLSGDFSPTSNLVIIPVKLSAGIYTLEITGTSCSGKAYRKFAIAGIPPPVVEPKVVAKSTPVEIFKNVFKIADNRVLGEPYVIPVSASGGWFLGQRDYSKVESFATTGLSGYDYNPVVMDRGELPWVFRNWVQADYYSISPIKVGPAYARNKNTNLWEFDLKFPEFTLPKGKTVALDTESERSSDAMLKRGVTYAKNTTDIGKSIYFVSDDWATRIGCPQAYTSSPEVFQNWIRSTSAETILNSFKYIISRYKDRGYIMLNWEAVMHNVPNDQRYKLANCLKWYSEQGFNAKIAAWTQTGLKTSRISFEGDYNLSCYDGVTTFTGTETEFRNKFCRWGGSPDYAKYLDVLQIGGYVNFQTETGIIHHYLIEYLVNKRYYPTKKILATTWHDVEAINWNLSQSIVGEARYWNKAAVFNQTMYNTGVWSVAVGDGFHMWSDPVKWTATLTDYPWGTKDLNDKTLPFVAGKAYARNNMKNMDWTMRGVYDVSQHSDIIEANTKWVFPTSPEKSFLEKSLLTAYKLSGDGTEALILAHDAFNGESAHEYNINVAGKGFDITVDGTWTSVKRIKL